MGAAGWLVEGAAEILSDLLEEGAAESAGETAAGAPGVLAAGAVAPVVTPSFGEGVSALAADDGGISDSRWDPKPVAGPYTP